MFNNKVLYQILGELKEIKEFHYHNFNNSKKFKEEVSYNLNRIRDDLSSIQISLSNIEMETKSQSRFSSSDITSSIDSIINILGGSYGSKDITESLSSIASNTRSMDQILYALERIEGKIE